VRAFKRISCGAGERWASRKYQGEQIMSNLGQLGFVHSTTGKHRFFDGLWHRGKGLVVGLALGATASVAWAGTSGVVVTVTPVASPIWFGPSSCSTPNCLYGAFRFTAQNTDKNISNLWIKTSADVLTGAVATGTTSIVQGADLPSFCTATTNTALCNVGALPPGAKKEFVLVVVSPAAASPPVSDPVKIRMNWQLTTGQGSSSQSPLSSQIALDSSVTTPGAGFIDVRAYEGLQASNTKQFVRAASYVPTSGTTFTSSGTSATTPTVIGLVKATVHQPDIIPTTNPVASLFAAATPGVCTTQNYPVCLFFGIQTPGTYGPNNLLVVNYVRHVSTIQGGNVKNAVIFYTPGSFNANNQFIASGASFPLLDCSVLPGGVPSSDPNAAANQKRCITDRIQLPDGSQQINALLSENGQANW